MRLSPKDHPPKFSSPTSCFDAIHLALRSIEHEGLQAPSLHKIQEIVEAAAEATRLFSAVAVRPVQQSELLEFFADFVVRCTNRPPGVGDAATH